MPTSRRWASTRAQSANVRRGSSDRRPKLKLSPQMISFVVNSTSRKVALHCRESNVPTRTAVVASNVPPFCSYRAFFAVRSMPTCMTRIATDPPSTQTALSTPFVNPMSNVSVVVSVRTRRRTQFVELRPPALMELRQFTVESSIRNSEFHAPCETPDIVLHSTLQRVSRPVTPSQFASSSLNAPVVKRESSKSTRIFLETTCWRGKLIEFEVCMTALLPTTMTAMPSPASIIPASTVEFVTASTHPSPAQPS